MTNREFKKLIIGTQRKVQMMMKLKNFGDVGRVELKPLKSWGGYFSYKMNENELTKLKELSIACNKIWTDSISKILKDYTDIKIFDIELSESVVDGSHYSLNPKVHYSELALIYKDFNIPNKYDIKPNFNLNRVGLKFKYSYKYIDFSKPAISKYGSSNITKQLVNFKGIDDFIEYISEDIKYNQNDIIAKYNMEVRNLIINNKIEQDFNGFKNVKFLAYSSGVQITQQRVDNINIELKPKYKMINGFVDDLENVVYDMKVKGVNSVIFTDKSKMINAIKKIDDSLKKYHNELDRIIGR